MTRPLVRSPLLVVAVLLAVGAGPAAVSQPFAVTVAPETGASPKPGAPSGQSIVATPRDGGGLGPSPRSR